ncbi:unnamed protein product [Chrysoparadoxa australica]
MKAVRRAACFVLFAYGHANAFVHLANPSGAGRHQLRLHSTVEGMNKAVGSIAAALSITCGSLGPLPSLATEGAATEIASPATVTATNKLDGDVKTLFERAQNAGSTSNFELANKLYTQVLRYQPGYVYGYSNRGSVRIALEDLPGAIDDYTTALQLAGTLPKRLPDLWLIYLNRGTTYMALNNIDAALRDMDSSLATARRPDVLIYANRAQAYEKLKKWDLAAMDYGQALTLNPGSVEPFWVRFGLALFEANPSDYDAFVIAERAASKFDG